jgi:hypothetical protein
LYRTVRCCVDVPRASKHSIPFNKWFREFRKKFKIKVVVMTYIAVLSVPRTKYPGSST